jgi:PAS domain S-box-containing protein
LPFHVHDEPRSRGVQTCLHAPLILGQRALGVVTANRLTQRPFTPEEARFISLSASLVAVALQGAVAFESTRAIVQNLPVATIVLDLDGKVTEWNPAAERMFGWSRDEALGRRSPHVPPEQWEEYTTRRCRVLSGEIIRGVEVRRRRKDGRPVEVNLWSAPIRNAAGHITGTMGFLIDLTELRRAEEAIRSGTAQMERLSRRVLDAHEDERRSIARELHDEVGQALTALSLLLGTVARSGEVDRLGEAQTLVTEAIERVRSLSLDLRPAMLDDAGLVPALVGHLERYAARTGVRVEFTHSGVEGRRFGSAVETAIYRIAQEALTNVARHAGLNQATMRLSADQGIIVLVVNDGGAGFDPDALPAAGSTGLESMRERSALLSGRTTILSAPGAGTRVTAVIPLD